MPVARAAGLLGRSLWTTVQLSSVPFPIPISPLFALLLGFLPGQDVVLRFYIPNAPLPPLQLTFWQVVAGAGFSIVWFVTLALVSAKQIDALEESKPVVRVSRIYDNNNAYIVVHNDGGPAEFVVHAQILAANNLSAAYPLPSMDRAFVLSWVDYNAQQIRILRGAQARARLVAAVKPHLGPGGPFVLRFLEFGRPEHGPWMHRAFDDAAWDPGSDQLPAVRVKVTVSTEPSLVKIFSVVYEVRGGETLVGPEDGKYTMPRLTMDEVLP